MNDLMAMTNYIPEAVLVLTNILTFFFMKRGREAKQEQEENLAKKGELDNIQDALSLYRDMMNDLREQLSRASETYQKLELEFQKIAKKEKECREVIKVLREENLEFYRAAKLCPHECELNKLSNN